MDPLEVVIHSIDSRLESIDKKLTIQNGRIGKLEQWRAAVAAVGAVVGVVVGYLLKP